MQPRTYIYSVFRSTASMALYRGRGTVKLGSLGSTVSVCGRAGFDVGVRAEVDVGVDFDASAIALALTQGFSA